MSCLAVAAKRLPPRVLALVSTYLLATHPATEAFSDDASVSIRITGTRFDCQEPLLAQEPGFERCEIYTVPRFTAPHDALLQVFGHCEATIKFKTRGAIMEDSETLHERFNAAIVDGEGLAPVTMVFKPPLMAVLDPVFEARVTDLRCAIDQLYDGNP